MGKLDHFTEAEFREIVGRSKSLKELSYNLGYTKGANNSRIINKFLDRYNISTSHFEQRHKQQHTYQDSEVFVVNSQVAQTTLRRRYSKGNHAEYLCAICGQEPIWNNKPLTLVLDHINGINNDNRLENLRWVCPNCDHQLDTFCAKNQKNVIKKQSYCIDCGAEIDRASMRCTKCSGKYARLVERPQPEELKEILISHNGNFTKVAAMFGITDNAIRKWCKEYDMPFHAKAYRGMQQSDDC